MWGSLGGGGEGREVEQFGGEVESSGGGGGEASPAPPLDDTLATIRVY